MDSPLIRELEETCHRGEYGRVLFRSDQLLRDPANCHLRALILFWKGKAHELAGRAWHGHAISCYREGIAAAGRRRSVKAKLLASLSTLFSHMGDCASLEQIIRSFERIATNQNPRVLRWGSWLWYNYGVALDNALQPQEAAKAFTTAIKWAREYQVKQVLGPSLHNLGGVKLALGQTAEAAAIMAEAEEFLSDKEYQHKKLSRRAEYFLAAGDLVSAHQMITAALIHPMTDDMTRADTYYTWAQTLHALGRSDEARDKALLALDYAVKSVHYPGLHKTNRLLQRFDGSASIAK